MAVTTVQAIPTTTSLFQQDQVLDFAVDFWDTPMTALEGDVASDGIPTDIRQPTSANVFTLKAQLLAATAANCASTFSNANYSASLVGTDGSVGVPTGRLPNLIGYWAGGAPGQHGASYAKQIAYHFSCYMRPVTGREWWSATASPTFCLAYAGSGYVRVTKTVSGVTTDVTYKDVSGSSLALNRTMTEGDFLQNGLLLSDSLSLAAGDRLDIYYIQDREDWGGYVFKPVLGATPTVAETNAAPVACASIFDDGVQPTLRTFNAIKDVTITRQLNGPADAVINLALTNPGQSDKIGWEFIRTASADDPGILRYNDGFTTYDVSRSRLIRVRAGFAGELYTVFVGHIDDFADVNSGTIAVQCKAFEQRMADQFVKNYPDKISYMAVGYKNITGTSSPVYEIEAFDNWPLEQIIKELGRRAGIDEAASSQTQGVTLTNGTTTTVTLAGELFSKFRARTPSTITDASGNLASKQIRAERQVHYGNAGRGFDPVKLADDQYLFPPENKDDIFSAIKKFVEKYGYDSWFDELGHWVLKSANNFHCIYTVDAFFGQTPAVKFNPDAISGTYGEWTNTVNPIIKNVTAARIDVVIPRGVSHGSWSYTVKDSTNGVTVASGTINPAIAAGTDEFFYDYRTTIDGTNSTVTTLYSGDYKTYQVTLQSSGTGALTRRLDSLLLWHTDTMKTRYTSEFGTQTNAVSVDAKGTMADARNHVIVVGRRKATVTDSTKFQNDNARNPNNPDAEFVVERAVDYRSILDPTVQNYIGYTKESIIYDTSITDLDFAGYLARTFIYRYRVPKSGADVNHTLVPMLQLKEPVLVNETRYDTIDTNNAVWVNTIRHSLTYGKFTTDFGATSYVSVPSFQPREDVDIDTNFGSNPVANVKISYTSLANSSCVNLGDQEEYLVPATIASVDQVVSTGSPNFFDMTNADWPPVPGTLFIRGRNYSTTPTSRQYAFTISPGDTGLIGDLQSISTVDVTITLQYQYNSGYTIDSQSSVSRPIWLTQFVSKQYLNISKSSSQPTSFYIGENGATTQGTIYYDYNTTSHSARLVFKHTDNTASTSVGFPTGVTFQMGVNYQGVRWDVANPVADNPYHHFTNVDYRTGAGQKRVYLPYKAGDNTTKYTQPAGVSLYTLTYRPLGPVDGSHNFSNPYYSAAGGATSPFYDPYTSELSYLVNINYDALVSGNYRISIRNLDDDTIVAWLTENSADPDNEELHWSYITAGGGKQLVWDGVDDIGRWNRRQSEQYAASAYGAFEQQEQPVIGKGFYVWNQEVGRGGGVGTRALISGELDTTTNIPVFGHGTYAKWYVKFEATNDTIAQIAATNDGVVGVSTPLKSNPRVLNSSMLNPAYNVDSIRVQGTATAGTATTISDTGKAWRVNQWVGYQVRTTSGTGLGQLRKIVSNTATQLVICASVSDPNIWTTNPAAGTGYNIESTSAIIYTHLAEPTKVELSKISDWFNVANYNESAPPTTDTGNWQDLPTADATMHNGKPVRIRFSTMQRPGTLWTGNANKTSFRLYRLAHLTATIFDQVTVFRGFNYLGTPIESRKVINRKFMNNEHTISYSDGAWMYGSSFKQNTTDTSGYEWVFLPKHFRKDFRGIANEALQFNDYLQLEEVPSWNNNRQLAGERSRLHYALMNYTFFLSAYTQDRSGRYVWCLNRKFLDRSKIVKNAYADWFDPATPGSPANSTTYRNTWPVDLNNQHRRTIITRQWQDEGTWREDQRVKWNFGVVSPTNLGYHLLRHKFKDHSPSSTTLNGNTWLSYGGVQVDQHSKFHRDTRTELPTEFGSSPNYVKRQFGSTATDTALGKWTWEGAPLWIPCITRDHHGYYNLPPMVDKNSDVYDYRTQYIYGQVDFHTYLGATDPNNPNTGDDVAAAQIWNSVAYDMLQAYATNSGKVRFWQGQTVSNTAGPAKNAVNTSTLDYGRQDEMNHYEDYRGIYSRGERPAEAPKKVTSTSPYYLNAYQYERIDVRQAYKQPLFPDYYATVLPDGWFQMKLRYEYLWESGSLFPTDKYGVPALGFMNAYAARMPGFDNLSPDVIRFDSGAWTGWKDDITVANDADANYVVSNNVTGGVFNTGFMPVARGPRLFDPAGNQITLDMIFALTLVNERRSQPVIGV